MLEDPFFWSALILFGIGTVIVTTGKRSSVKKFFGFTAIGFGAVLLALSILFNFFYHLSGI